MKNFFLSAEDRKHLAGVIRDVEKTTSGEIRLVLVKRSSAIAPVVSEIWLMLVILSLLVLLAFRIEWVLDFRWWWVAVSMLVSLPVAWCLAKWSWLEKKLMTHHEIAHAVATRAELEFYREGLLKTKDRTGVLVFLSLFERKALVLGDVGIHQKLKADDWNQVIEQIVSSGKDGKWREHLEEALRTCGRLLSQHFPAQAGDRNELANEIVIKD